MTQIQLTKIDLNLLVVLDILLHERSVTRAAERLNITSSAVSHALKRLRTLFDNELLVRDGRRMMPTARGEELGKTLPILLKQVEHTLATPEAFDPVTSDRVFRLAAPDFISSLIPHLLNIIAKEAPGVRIEIPTYSESAASEMRQGRYDALIAPSFLKNDDLRGEVIGKWSWAVYGRNHHPAFKDWSLGNWAQFGHLQISTTTPTGRGPIDRTMQQLGLSRQIGAVVPYFSMAAPILAQTDMLLTVPSVAMDNAANIYGLQRRDVPFDLQPLEFSLFRSATAGDKPDIGWFYERVALAAQNLVSKE